MNRDELIKSFENEIFSYKSFNSDEIFLRNLMEDVDKYLESQQVSNKKIVINSLLYLGQSISEVHRLAFNISELLKVDVEFNFNGVEMTVDNKTSFEDFKEEFIERVSILHV